jgi:V/A-type H+-transporting ATPase subunit I
MIVTMIKYNFLLYHGDLNPFLEQLQELGMIHVESRNVEIDEKTNNLIRQADNFKKIYSELQNGTTFNGIEFNTPLDDAYNLAEMYSNVKEQLAMLDASTNKIGKDIEDAIPWGEFNEIDIDRIISLGITPKFYAIPIKQFDENLTNIYPLYEINRYKGKIYFVILQDNQDFTFDFQEIKPPSKSYIKLQEEAAQLKEQYFNCEKQLKTLALSSETLLEERRNLMNQIDYNIAKLSVQNEAGDNIKILTGWLPKANRDKFEAFLETQATVYFAEEEIKDDDEPPVLLKNNRFTRLFEPITNMYSLPNYRELDPTPFFAPFFMLFFGFCLGDGGYGLIILAVASFLKIKIKNANIRPFLTLAQYMGAATLLFGLITATFLGVSMDQIRPDKIIEQRLGVPESFGMMILSLILGFIQIIFAMFINAAKIVKQKGWRYALSTWAWIVVIVGGIILYVLKDNSGSIAVLYIVGGVWCLAELVALFYNSPGKNPFINLGSGLWTTYNMISGLMGDILSYIRLFVLGLTGGILGGVFNNLAIMTGENLDIPLVSQLITLIILLFGHGLNFSLNVLSAVVHPLRLTYVEYYKNSGFDGGGYPFKLFEKIKS